MRGLSKEAKLEAIKKLRKVLAKKMKHELNETEEFQEEEDMGGKEMPSRESSISIHIGKGDIDSMDRRMKKEEEVDPEDRPVNKELRESLVKFMHDEKHIKPKGVARVVMGGPKMHGMDNKMNSKMEEMTKKPGRPKKR